MAEFVSKICDDVFEITFRTSIGEDFRHVEKTIRDIIDLRNEEIKAMAAREDENNSVDGDSANQGHWYCENHIYCCSLCQRRAPYDRWKQQVRSEYCPNCGALMREEA